MNIVADAGVFTEQARPKVNLTLAVKGRRPDGYHELESLVAFADGAADMVSLNTGCSTVGVTPFPVVSTGRFAPTIAGENLLDVTLRHIAQAAPTLILGAVTLEKNLPTAAGIGGGSADAAALIRAVIRANHPWSELAIDWVALATGLGADVPVCLQSSAQVMGGIGERLSPLPGLPMLAAVLANPLVAVAPDKTARVFRTLAAPPLSGAPERRTPLSFGTRADLVAHMREVGNDLTRPALAVVPQLKLVLDELGRLPGCELAQMSGGGPTCFGIFETAEAARTAADILSASQPEWWVVPTSLA